jgi:hypothetical protein
MHCEAKKNDLKYRIYLMIHGHSWNDECVTETGLVVRLLFGRRQGFFERVLEFPEGIRVVARNQACALVCQLALAAINATLVNSQYPYWPTMRGINDAWQIDPEAD